MTIRRPTFVLLAALLASCSGPQPAPPSASPPPLRPLALRGSDRITMEDLRGVLLEMNGEAAIEEVVLNRVVDLEAASRSIDLSDAQIAQERNVLIRTMAADPDRAERMLREIRLEDGLGPKRFAALLRRTALLRAMVQEDVRLSAALIRSVWDAKHGPKRTSQIIALESPSVATTALDRLAAGEAFAEVARNMSRDASRTQGGRLPAVSRLDPAWPEAFRAVLFETPVGNVSPPISIDGRFLLIKPLENMPPTGHSFDEGHAAAERAARLSQERVLMDRLSRELLAQQGTTILDPIASWRDSPQ